MAITMAQVAKVAGTSRATVSDVLRNRWQDKGISRNTYKKVCKALEETEYMPNHLARSLVHGRTYTIGIQIPTFQCKHWASVVKYYDIEARKRGFHILLAAPAEWQAEREEILRLCEYRVDGLIISLKVQTEIRSVSESLSAHNMFFVFHGDRAEEGGYCVLDDNEDQARLAVEHLIKLGHTRIAHIAGSLVGISGQERSTGYCNTLKKHGLPLRDDYLQDAGYGLEEARDVMTGFLRLSEPPTAVYCASDTMALGAIEAIESAGLRIPDDIAVVGHGDDLYYAPFYRIGLTTIRQPAEKLAATAVDMLVNLIEGRKVKQKVVLLPGELIIRDSCGANKS
ncbi:MAG: LacI family DNA-binding transcriptional regulator [Planctomycetota bacterium]